VASCFLSFFANPAYSLNVTKPASSLVSSLVSPAKYSHVPLSKKRFHPYHKPKDPSSHFYSPDIPLFKKSKYESTVLEQGDCLVVSVEGEVQNGISFKIASDVALPISRVVGDILPPGSP
jgi:hypothetical protein